MSRTSRYKGRTSAQPPARKAAPGSGCAFTTPRPGMVPHRRTSVYSVARAALILLTCLLLASPSHAIDENLTKGATNNHIFEAGVWGENIDVLNGGVNLTIPLGPEYKVSDGVTYRLQLAYSSKIWSIEESGSYWGGNLHHRARSRLQGRGQAGLGFSLHLGRTLTRANSIECPSTLSPYSKSPEPVFEDSTGAAHPFGGLRGASDGSHINIHGSLTSARLPSGTEFYLGHYVADLLLETDPNRVGLDWPRCAYEYPPPSGSMSTDEDIYTNDYRGNYLTSMRGKDRSCNGQACSRVEIEYENQNGMRHLMKSITPYFNNVADLSKKITFVNDNSDPNGQALPMGYVKSVTVPVFSDTPGTAKTATYTFNYIVDDVYDPFVLTGGNDYYAADNADGKFERELLLSSITFPEGYTMSFQYTGSGWQGKNIGFLRKRTLPTGARVEYDYAAYAMEPAVCNNQYGGFCYAHFSGWTHGISSKTLVPDPNQSLAHTWTYTRYATGAPNPYVVVTTDPLGNDVVSYFHAAQEGLPFSCGSEDWNDNEPWKNGRSYRTEYYRGSSAYPGNRVRTEEQDWDSDKEICPVNGQIRVTGLYPRITETRVIYHDDGNKASRTKYDEYDGFGNFRKITEYGFDGLPYRVQRTDHNCDVREANGLCFSPVEWYELANPPDPNFNQKWTLNTAHTQNWVLGTYSYSQTEDPNGIVLRRTEASFDGLGYITAQKNRLTITPGTNYAALVGDPTTGSAGDIKTEFRYEGDPNCPAGAAAYATGNLCYRKVSDYGHTPGVFEESYTYQNGPFLATKKLGSFSWKVEDRDVDPATGLTRVSRDANGIATSFNYDSLGRLKQVTPAGTEKAATLTYPDIWTTELEQRLSDTDKIFSRFSFDKLGRLWKVEKRQSDGTLAAQTTQYDPLGRMTFRSEWGDPNSGTTYDYTDPLSDPAAPHPDPFGRVRKTITADGKVTRTDYAGTSSNVTVEEMQVDFGPPVVLMDVKSAYEMDAFGRLTKVLSHRTYPPSGNTIRAGADAIYTYDRLDRLTQVKLEYDDPNTQAVASQLRTYLYNPLGQQLMATNPENGTSLNLLYDAAGNLLKRQDSMEHVFTYEYDAASRLVRARGGADPNTLAVENVYDQTAGAFGAGLGKLTTSTSFDQNGQALVREEWRYGGLNGRLSQRSWRVGKWNPTITEIASQPELVMSYAYNNLGLAASVTYPEKPNLGRTVLSPQLTYTNGFLASMSDPNRGSFIQSIQYNPAGGVRSIKTRGDVETVIAPDVRNRPASITISRVSPSQPVAHFSSGAYGYDGAGNITQIGDDKFAYDALNRLVKAKVNDTASAKVENLLWEYDPLGNMTRQYRATDSTSGTVTADSRFTIKLDKNQIKDCWVTRTGGPFSDPVAAMNFDPAGNLMGDPKFNFVYDPFNRLNEVQRKSDGSIVARYTYDANGYRLSKYDAATGLTVFYLRDSTGQTLSEFRRADTPGIQPFWLKDYVYAAGRHVAMIENENPAVPGGASVSWALIGEEFYRVTLEWAQGPDLDLTGYIVERSGGGQTMSFNVQPASNRILNDSSVEFGVTYTYRLSAIDSAGKLSGWGEPIVVTPGDTVPPGAPTPIAAVAGDARVDLSWSAPSDADLWSFQVQRREAPSGNWTSIGGALHKSQTTFTDLAVSNGVQYDYTVMAVDTSSHVSAGVPAPPAWRVTPLDTMPPAVPQDFYAIPASTQIDLYWRAGFEPNLTYRIYRRMGPTDTWTALNTTSATSYQSLSLQPNTTYRYAVSALDQANNESTMSPELVITTRDLVIPQPTLTALDWGYCLSNDYSGPCYLKPYEETDFTHENWRRFHPSWADPNATGAVLKGFRLYSRPAADEAYTLAREVLVPTNNYPVAQSIAAPNFHFQDNGYDPDDACDSGLYRVSALAEINGVTRESVLSAGETTLNPVIAAPENLRVSFEPVDPNACTYCPATGINAKRLNSDFFGLTLNWTPGGATCGGALRGYNIYRSRHGGGVPIRLTKAPTPVPVFRVDYLPLAGPNAASGKGYLERVFPGPMGTYSGISSDPASEFGDLCGKQYRVSAVDAEGTESALSNPVYSHADDPNGTQTVSRDCYGVSINTELPLTYPQQPAFAIPAVESVVQPQDFTGLTWSWHYGRAATPADVGPFAGNWALVTWNGAPGDVNEYRLLRKRTGESNFTEVTNSASEPLRLIPGDDLGIREFIWEMPLELACEDANYAMHAVDLYGRPTDPNEAMSNVITHSKYKLIPENPTAAASSGTITVSWDALPGCSGDLKGYTLLRSNSSFDSCTTSAPTSPTDYSPVGTVTAPGTSLPDNPPGPVSKRRWYRVVANWYDWTAGNQSGMSAAVCISPDGQTASLSVPGNEAVASVRRSADDLERLSPLRAIGQFGGNDPAVKLSFYHVDHLGTPRVVTDVSGNALSTHKYLPFGEELTPPGSTNTHEFTGHERDGETGLDYMLARYYGIGSVFRFLSVDPVMDYRRTRPRPHLWNRYTYADNNPLKYSDPDGRIVVNKASNAVTSSLVNDALKHSPVVQKLHKDPNILVTVQNGPTKGQKGGEHGGLTHFHKKDGKIVVTITIDADIASTDAKNNAITSVELGRAVQVHTDFDAASAASQHPDGHGGPESAAEAAAIGQQIAKDIEQGKAPKPKESDPNSGDEPSEQFKEDEKDAAEAKSQSETRQGFRSAGAPTSRGIRGR